MSKYPEYSHEKSRAWFDRALNVIPSGVYGHLGPSEGLFLPLEKWPLISSKAEGTYFWDMDGNRYLDFLRRGRRQWHLQGISGQECRR